VTNADEKIDLELPKEVLMRTGRQMASDFREGLWTFIEDLRQATVGEEGVNGVQPTVRQPQQKMWKETNGQANLYPTNRPNHAKRQGVVGSTTARKSSRAKDTRDTEGKGSLIDVDNSFWKEHGLDSPNPTETPVVRKHAKKSSLSKKQAQEFLDQGESWDMWDSPAAQQQKAEAAARHVDQAIGPPPSEP